METDRVIDLTRTGVDMDITSERTARGEEELVDRKKTGGPESEQF